MISPGEDPEAAYPRMRPTRESSIAILVRHAHNDKTHLTQARNRSDAACAVRTETYDNVFIRLRRRSRQTKSRWSTDTDGEWQQPGFRCSDRVMALLQIAKLYDFLFSLKHIDGRTERLLQDLSHSPIGRIPTGDPDHLRGRSNSIKQTQKITVLGHHYDLCLSRCPIDLFIPGIPQSDSADRLCFDLLVIAVGPRRKGGRKLRVNLNLGHAAKTGWSIRRLA